MASDQSFRKSSTINDDSYNNLSNDIDWYGFENRIRKLLHQITEPTIKRMVDTKDMVDKVSTQNEYLSRRVDELEFIMHKSHKRNIVFDDFNKRLSKLEDRQHSTLIEYSSNFETIKFQNNLTGEKIQYLEQNFENLNHRVEDLVEKLQKSRLENTRETKNKLNEFTSHIRDKLEKVKTFDYSISKLEHNMTQIEKSLTDHIKLYPVEEYMMDIISQ